MKNNTIRKILIFVGFLLIVIGIVLLVIKTASPEYVDEDGLLHEKFYLLALGLFSAITGLIDLFVVGICIVVRKIRN